MSEKDKSEQDKENGKKTDEHSSGLSGRTIKLKSFEMPILMFVGIISGILVAILLIFLLLDSNNAYDRIVDILVHVETQESEDNSSLVSLSTSADTTSSTTPTRDLQNLTSIEDFPGTVFDFSSGGGYGWLNVIRSGNGDFDYQFNYAMPQDNEDAFAGIFFDFTPTRNLTEFKSLQITISFSDDDTICLVYLEDQTGAQNHLKLGLDEHPVTVDVTRWDSAKVFTIPLAENFPDTNMQSINGVGIGAGHIEGLHICTVQEIYLLK